MSKTKGRTAPPGSSPSPSPASPAAAPAAPAELLFVDAIEGDVARLILGTTAFNVPARLLPTSAREGSWLRPSFALAPAPPDDSEALRRRLGADDDGGDIKL